MDLQRHGVKLLSCVAVLFGLLFILPIAQAQDPKPENGKSVQDAKSGESKTAGEDTTIMEMIFESGPTGWVFMGVLGLFSLGGATVAIERAVNTRRSKIVPADFVRELNASLQNRDAGPERFQAICSNSVAPVSLVLKSGLLRIGRPLPEIEKSMEDAAAREMATVRSRIKPLNVVGSVAPLVGLLGTVVGMILAFQQTANTTLSGPEKAMMLAKGIYMALLTTAAGLTIAIPCLLLSALFNSKVETYFREIDEHMMDVIPQLDPPPAPMQSQAPPPLTPPPLTPVPVTQQAAADEDYIELEPLPVAGKG
jgi:biopolymer transport protein ExbB